jgi:hypothetical protein
MLKFPISGVRIFVVKEAISNIGYGEKEANNDGPLIRAMGGRPGEEWCALFAGWCYRKSFEYNEYPPPAFAWRDKKQTFLEVSAKRLIDGLAKTAGGVRFTDPAQALPGDLISWHRGLNPWQGHIGVVEFVRDGLVHTIEGNVGSFPAKVKRLVHDVSKERLYTFAGVR